jgi:hypothetical protein
MSSVNLIDKLRIFVRRNIFTITLYLLGLLIVSSVLTIGYISNDPILNYVATATIAVYFVFLLLNIFEKLGIKVNLMKKLSGINSGMERNYIEEDIENIFNQYNLAYPLPDKYKFVWKDPDEELAEGEVVLSLDKSENQERNLSLAALEYAQKALISHARTFMHPDVSTSLDYFVAEDILRNNNKTDAVGELYNEFMDRHGEIPEYLTTTQNAMSELRSEGMFGTALLHEYSKLTEQKLSPELKEETVKYLFQLQDIVDSDIDEPMAYNGEYISVGLGIIGGNISERKYKRLWRKSLRKYKTTYLIAEGNNIGLAERIYSYFDGHPKICDKKEKYFKFSRESRYENGYFVQVESERD